MHHELQDAYRVWLGEHHLIGARCGECLRINCAYGAIVRPAVEGQRDSAVPVRRHGVEGGEHGDCADAAVSAVEGQLLVDPVHREQGRRNEVGTQRILELDVGDAETVWR